MLFILSMYLFTLWGIWMLIPRFPHSPLQSSMPMHPLLGSGTKRGTESLCVCVPLHCLFSKAAGMLQTLGERKVPAWKVIADCSVGSVQCASLVFFVSNQSFKFPALSGVGCVNLHARLLAENDPIYQLFGYLCMFLFCWGRIDWVAIYKLAWGARFYVWCAQCHFQPFMEKCDI